MSDATRPEMPPRFHICSRECYDKSGYRICDNYNSPRWSNAYDVVNLPDPAKFSEVTKEELDLMDKIIEANEQLIRRRETFAEHKTSSEFVAKKLEDLALKMATESEKIQTLLDEMIVLKKRLFESLKPVAEVQVLSTDEIGRSI